MAPKGKSPLRKISRLGLDQLLGQIVAQASSQAPPAGTTTTAPAGMTPTGPPAQPGMAGGSSRPGQSRPLDANGDYFVPEGLPAGATPATQAAPLAGVAPASPMPGTTTTSMPPAPTGNVNGSTLAGFVDGVNGQPVAAPVNGAPGSAPSISPYRNIGEIFAEQPPSDDPQTMFAFQRERLNKIGRFYGMSDEELAQAQSNVSGMLGMAVQKPGMTPVEAQSLVSQLFQAEGTKIIQANDAKAYGNDSGRMSPPPFTGTDPNAPTSTFGEDNPLSVYGVYTPEQIAAIQGQIGQYVNQYQDRFSQAAGGWRPSAAMQDAYARQAQAIPAVQALEGQAALAQELARVKEQNQYYQMMAQMPQGDSSSSSSDAMSDEEMSAFVNSLTGG